MLSVANVKAQLAKCLDANEKMLSDGGITHDVWQARAATLGTYFNIAQGMSQELIEDCLNNAQSGIFLDEYLRVCEEIVQAYGVKNEK